jgi:peptidoglycan LD-endopeptidase LytH
MRRLKHLAALGFLPLLVLAGACVTMPLLDPRYYELLSQPAPQSLPVPVEGAAKGRLWDSYGDPRSGGRQHEGIDIFAKRNTPVLSATEGYVSGLGTNGLGGITVWVTGPAGWRHYYAHLERWGDVRQGQWVEAGTVIGYVGNSGNAATTAPHLHYGIYPPSGGTLNPFPLLAAGPGPALARQPIAEEPAAETADEGFPVRGIGRRILEELKGVGGSGA